MPHVVGVRLTGELPRGSTATDLVLVVTEMLRSHGVVGAFVEFAGDGLAGLSLADRATISNMSPEFGATATLFPIDDETLRLPAPDRAAGGAGRARSSATPRSRACGASRATGPTSTSCSTLDLATVVPSVAGPRRPQDRVPLEALRDNFRTNFPDGLEATTAADGGSVEEASGGVVPGVRPAGLRRAATPTDRAGPGRRPGRRRRRARGPARATGRSTVEIDGERATIRTGSVAIAAITSCTNTSNPTVMVGAGLLARNAVARGLRVAADGQDVARARAPGP